jgi:hypothetical protein
VRRSYPQEERRFAYKAHARGSNGGEQHCYEPLPLDHAQAGRRYRRADQSAEKAMRLAHRDAKEVGEVAPRHSAREGCDHRYE